MKKKQSFSENQRVEIEKKILFSCAWHKNGTLSIPRITIANKKKFCKIAADRKSQCETSNYLKEREPKKRPKDIFAFFFLKKIYFQDNKTELKFWLEC